MMPITPLAARNYSSLGRIATLYPLIRPYISEILAAYRDYAQKRGDPALVIPLSGLPQKIDAIRSVLKECYAATRVRDNLDWIDSYRNNHGFASCPMCGAMHVKSIDHYLPQSWYPEFSIFSLNLVPSCITCNQKRSDSANMVGVTKSMLHPFFDGIAMSEGFLFAVNIGSYELPHFVPSALHSDPSILPRIGEHIRRSIDKELFQTWLLDRWGHVRSIASRKNTTALLTAELSIMLNDEAILTGPNNWNAALLRGILRDPEAIDWLVINPLNLYGP